MQDLGGFYSHMVPNSLVVTVVNDRTQQDRYKSTPKDKESKRTDLIGRKISTSSSLQMHIANQQALLSKYDFINWTAMSKFVDQLPEAFREKL